MLPSRGGPSRRLESTTLRVSIKDISAFLPVIDTTSIRCVKAASVEGVGSSGVVESWTVLDLVRSDTRMGDGSARGTGYDGGGGYSGVVENQTVLDLAQPDTLMDAGWRQGR